MDEWFEVDLFEEAAAWVFGVISDNPSAARRSPRRPKWIRRHRFVHEDEEDKILAKARAAKRTK